MPNYGNGKTYFIWNTTAPVYKLYIGSTVSTLKHRLTQHEYEFEHQRNQCESHRLLAMGNYDIQLLENYPCENKQQLEDREAEYIIANWDSCVNKQVPGAIRRAGGIKKYDKQRDKNPERKEYKKQYNQRYNKKNAEKIAAWQGQIIECHLCGSMCSRGNIARHRQTKTCREAVKSQVTNVLDDMIKQIC